jgi:PAS domain S-box-containing protein
VATNRALNREIGERREVEQALRVSEKNYRDLVDSVSSIILRWDDQGRIIFMNSYGLFFFGYQAEEIVGRNVLGTIVPETDVGNALKVADRLREKIDGLQVNVEGHSIHYTVGIGLTAIRPEDESLREMVRRAAGALYEAKGTGRNRVAAH